MTPTLSTSQLLVEFPGIPVKLGRTWYIMPTLSMGQVEKLAPIVESFFRMIGRAVKPDAVEADQQPTPSEQWKNIAEFSEVIYEALRLNYPDIQREEIMRCVNLRTYGRLFPIAIGTHPGPWTTGIDSEGKPLPEMVETVG